MSFGAGAYMWVTMSPRLSSGRMARIGEKRLADVDHHRKIEGGGRLLSTPQRFEIVGVGHVFRQPRLDADDNITMARDRPLRQSNVGS
jgi:hypothetical protein